jgi:hypothetical protein
MIAQIRTILSMAIKENGNNIIQNKPINFTEFYIFTMLARREIAKELMPNEYEYRDQFGELRTSVSIETVDESPNRKDQAWERYRPRIADIVNNHIFPEIKKQIANRLSSDDAETQINTDQYQCTYYHPDNPYFLFNAQRDLFKLTRQLDLANECKELGIENPFGSYVIELCTLRVSQTDPQSPHKRIEINYPDYADATPSTRRKAVFFLANAYFNKILALDLSNNANDIAMNL